MSNHEQRTAEFRRGAQERKQPRSEQLGSRDSEIVTQKSGVALIVVMWVIVIISLVVSSFAFEMQLEARIITAQRKRFQADQLAQAGIELAKTMLSYKEDPFASEDAVIEDPYLKEAAKIAEGIPAQFSEELGNGIIRIQIDYEKGRRNISKLTPDEWRELFTQADIPTVDWDELLGCLKDWQDPGDEHGINGAESDDSFYRERGYECKNAPVDTVDELLLIKGWTEEVLYGTPEEDLDTVENPMRGVAQNLTTWGADNKVNPNSASRDVLHSLYLSESLIEDIIEMRRGPDGDDGTEDDGLTEEDFAALGLSAEQFTLKPEYVTVTSEGEVGGVVSHIYSVFKLGKKEPSPLFWLEGDGERL